MKIELRSIARDRCLENFVQNRSYTFLLPFFDFKQVKNTSLPLEMKKRGRRIILEKKRDKRGSRSLGAYAGHVSVVYQQKTLPVVFRFELFRRKIGIPCVILYCPDTGYIYIYRERGLDYAQHVFSNTILRHS